MQEEMIVLKQGNTWEIVDLPFGKKQVGLKNAFLHRNLEKQVQRVLEVSMLDRYQIFQNVCIQHQIGVLLVAHHADDQVELFILRLSRDSGVLGLAGMAFASQLGNQEWVEDPTNQNPSFARNRIRLSLRNLPSCTFKYELQAVISACRKTRAYVDQICSNLINEVVSVMAGYAVIDLEILHPSKIEDICLSKFIALVLQVIHLTEAQASSRQYFKIATGLYSYFPMQGHDDEYSAVVCDVAICRQTSLTAAGCYLCAAPRSKGTKLLVCCSVNSPLPSKMELFYRHCYETHKHYIPSEVEQIIVDGKANSDNLVPDASDVQFLDVASSESILVEAKRRNILSESTYSNILSLQEDETKHFKSKTKTISDHDLKMHGVHTVSTSLSLPLQPGQICYFMNRFLVSWNLSNKISGDKSPVEEASCNRDLAGKSLHHFCRHCMVGHDMVAEVRHMVDADWLYLAKLSKHQNLENHERKELFWLVPWSKSQRRQFYVQILQGYQQKELSTH
ncbi:hypothetical protein CK203_071114 [Vitis vinifera]|uniref:tRNA(Ile)-lysidine synthetase n=1 Tax=Vitis vinifera TaxID=29760 RepID=A0A438DS03_VITVI|nr:hypothetical protein CK203_071114 [Vitis vinifera]